MTMYYLCYNLSYEFEFEVPSDICIIEETDISKASYNVAVRYDSLKDANMAFFDLVCEYDE